MNPAPQAENFARWMRRRSIPRHKNGRPDRLPRDASGPRARSRSRARRLRAGGRLPLGATPCHQHHQLGGSELTQLDTLSSKIATSCFQIQPRELAVQAALTAKSHGRAFSSSGKGHGKNPGTRRPRHPHRALGTRPLLSVSVTLPYGAVGVTGCLPACQARQ